MNNNNNMEFDTTQTPNNNSYVFKPELIISQAINLSEDFIPIDEIKLAEIANFTPKEISMLKLFWNPCFNSTWIYLSDEIILNFLTNSKTEDAVNNFMRKVLITNNEKEIDYLQVDKNHEIVKNCPLFFTGKNEDSLQVNIEKTKRVASNKKYYIVSGECFKNLLMQTRCEAGKETRKYYLKVEQLSRTMYKYITELNKKQHEDAENKYNLLFKNHQSYLKRKKRTPFEKGDCVYVLSNPYRQGKLEYKVGKVDQKDKGDAAIAAFINRLSTYNTGLPEDYIVEYVCYVKHPKLIEDMIKGKYEEYFKVTNKEWIFNKELVEICELVRNCCTFLGFDFVEKIPNLKLKDELEIKVEEVFEDQTTEDYESDDEDEFDDTSYKRMKEIDSSTSFKQIRKICKEKEIIQLGGKADMIRRLVRFENINNRKYDSDVKSDEESKINEDDSFVYQYNNKGEFIARFKCIKDIKIDGVNKNDIKECLENKTTKAGNFIWRKKETKFTKDELKEINRKNCMTIIKIDKDGNEIERYNTIKEASEKNNIGRGVIDRMVESKEFRDGIGYKILNRENKVSTLKPKDKENLVKDYDNGMSIDDLCTKYGKVRKYMLNLVKKLKSN
jgi:phage anti-repressor protein